jgi:hypothetical protein
MVRDQHPPVDNSPRQLEAAAAGAELVELEPFELELDLSDDDFSDDDLSDEDELEVVDSELLLEPLIVLLAASRLSVR